SQVHESIAAVRRAAARVPSESIRVCGSWHGGIPLSGGLRGIPRRDVLLPQNPRSSFPQTSIGQDSHMLAELDAPSLRGSFRDPAGSVLHHRGRILRVVHGDFASEMDVFLRTNVARNAVTVGELVASAPVCGRDFPELDLAADDVLFEHEKIA